MCDKVPYTTRKLAIDAARAISRRIKTSSMKVYKCRECVKVWHLTSSKK